MHENGRTLLSRTAIKEKGIFPTSKEGRKQWYYLY